MSRADESRNKVDLESTSALSLKDFRLGKFIAQSSNGIVYAAKCVTDGFEKMGGADKKANKDNGNDSDNDFPLAIKMMFNYYVESNAGAIFKAMKKETVVAQPSGVSLLNEDIIDESKLSVVPPHPNIVKMYAAFADSIPELENAKELYPDALPTRINPSGYGRNMSLFLVMKKYKSNLRDYLEQRPDLHWRSSLMLLAQLLEGIVHLQRHRVAHRDLKSDNILLDFEEKRASKVDDECPRLVISDFGCCLADPDHGLRLPYLSVEVDRGGNAALMAPEVANSKPGVFSFINYDKADLWAVGAMAYEIFGQNNPFYESAKPRLNNRRYR